MKKYKVTGASVTTHKGLTYRNGSEIPVNKLDEKSIAGLVKDGVIAEVVPVSETPKTKKPNEAV